MHCGNMRQRGGCGNGGSPVSKPRYKWWGYVKAVIRYYPKYERELKDLRQTSVVAGYTGMPHTGGISDPTAQAAVRQLAPDAQREYEAVLLAIQRTRCMPNGPLRLKLIRLVYWDRSHTVDGAGLAVGYRSAQARRIHNQFVRAVAKNLSLLTEDDTPEPK